MWIVRLALNRPYTIAVMALLILLMGVVAIRQTPTDIFPRINIPVITMIWTYRGLSTDEMEKMITNFSETATTNNVSDIRQIESQTHNGIASSRCSSSPTCRSKRPLPR
jgi:multidrug efflux pump subunit AcrB